MDRAEVIRGQRDVGGDLVGVGGERFATAGGGAFPREVAELHVHEVDLAVERAGLVAEAVGGLHDFHPDGQRKGGAVAAVDDFLRLVEAGPDGAGEGGCVAGKPSVHEIVGGAGLAAAGLVEAEPLDGGRGAAGGDLVEDARDRPRGAALGGRVGQRRSGIEDVSIPILDLGNQIGPEAHAVVREDRVGAGHLPRRRFPGAEEGNGRFRHRRAEASHAGDFLHRGNAGVVPDPDGHRIPRADESGGNGQHAAEFTVGILRPPSAATLDLPGLDRPVADGGIRAQALIEGSQIDERLEQRADLPLGLDRAVEAGLVRIPPADDGEHGTGAVFHDHGGALQILGLLAFHLGNRLPRRAGLVRVAGVALDLAELLIKRFLAFPLEPHVHRGDDLEPAELDVFLFENNLQIADDGEHRVGFLRFAATFRPDLDGLGLGHIRLRLADDAGGDHAVERGAALAGGSLH